MNSTIDDDEVPQLLEVDGDGDSDEAPALEAADSEFDAGGRRLVRNKVPLTLLTGYLGAGKSTLLDYILTAEHGYRIAVCMNDFGDTTDIEAKSLQMSNPTDPNAPSSSMLTLPNGCLCCSFKDMGIAAIEEMVAAEREKIDWVMVELTGLADPGPIAKDFWANEEMGDLVLDSVVCVVDSRNVLKQLAEVRDDGATNEAQKQVACADVILLNKTDLVSAQDLDEVAATVAGINPTLRVHKTVRGQVPLKEVFDLRAFTSPAVAALEPADSACCSASGPDHTHNHNRAHAAGPNAVSTATLPLPPLSTPQFERLNALLESLLWHRKWPADMPSQPAAVPDVLRTKGYAVLADGSARLIQGVSDLFEIRELADEGGVRPKVVFIGRGVEGLDERAAAYVGV